MTPGEHFRFRLERQIPRGSQAGCALALGIFLTLVGAIPIAMAVLKGPEEERTFFYVWGGAFIAVGLFVIYAGIVQKLAQRWPETIVETDAEKLPRGKSVEFYFCQPGPVNLISLRANLVGEEQWVTRYSRYDPSTRSSQRDSTRHTRSLGTFNFLDRGAAEVNNAQPLELFASLHVPSNIPPTSVAGDEQRRISWKIEVWGKVKGGADFMHPFEVTVT